MKFTTLEKVLLEKIKPAIVDVTPGVHVKAYQGGRLACDITVGETQPYYDLSSLTKIIFNQQKWMHAFDQGLWNFSTKVKDLIPEFFDEEILVKDLLTHTAGLEWWKPFYKTLWPDGSSSQGMDWKVQRQKLWKLLNTPDSVSTDLAKYVIPNSNLKKAVYSDLDILILGYALENLFKKNLNETWEDVKAEFYPNSTFHFNLNHQTTFEKSRYAPTEFSDYRKKTVCGEVHDENTWSLGGLSTHAGLFGSADDVSQYGLLIRSQLHGIARYKIRQKTAQLFTQRALSIEQGDWAMGYMLPSPESASCGPLFSIHSIGHTGFTGTSLWYDPRRDLLVVVLSNRVNYSRENQRFLKLRPQIHTWVFEATERNLSI